jgi:D-beta-D-heptose 7-phosphate kinase/D-beta-D-heptose 1-phosphate adenosyltransferase
MLDVYLNGTTERISREAPVPIVNVTYRENVPGGAANAALNFAALGARVALLTVTGDDGDARTVLRMLDERGVQTDGVLCAPDRETLAKRRVISEDHLLVRYDTGSTTPIPALWERRLIARLKMVYADADAVLLSDYGYGVLTSGVIKALKALRDRDPKPLVVDSKDLTRFAELRPDAVKPNYGEAARLLNLSPLPDRVEQVSLLGPTALDLTGARIVALTLDSDGAVIFERGEAPFRTYAQPVQNSKAVGAGDTYAAALTLCLALRLPTVDAAEVAAAAANVVVKKTGTVTCSTDELQAYFFIPQKIIRRRAELNRLLDVYRALGKRIVFTNGCFDILHRGHVSYLTQAKARGDVLIVGVNTDASVRRLKGADRPINPLDDRMEVLAALDCVDHVVSFGESTPIELIKLIQPHVFTKGGNYAKSALPEAPVVEALGGVVEILPYLLDRSTTEVIRKIQLRSSSGD